jgi:hypothetical protein
MRISDFKSSVSGSNGLARANRFSVVMQMPAGIVSAGVTPFSNLLLFCDQATLPGLTVNTTPVRTFGEVRETPTEFMFEPVTLSFYVDQNMLIRGWFNNWIKYIQNGDTRTFKYYDDFICKQMQINVQDSVDQTRHQVHLYEVWPKSVGAIQLDYASKDIMKMSVTLQYKYWKYVSIPAPARITPDLYSVKSVPEEYYSDVNSFQQNFAQNRASNPNGSTETIVGTVPSSYTDVW